MPPHLHSLLELLIYLVSLLAQKNMRWEGIVAYEEIRVVTKTLEKVSTCVIESLRTLLRKEKLRAGAYVL